MLRELIILTLTLLVLTSCAVRRDAIIERQKEKVVAEVELGDDIFKAKEKLESAGFRIKYGPGFPTKTKRYLEMIVDYGLNPSELDALKYSYGIEGGGTPITGLIRATPEGKITRIE